MGASFVVVKATLGEVSPSRLVSWRFIVATFTLLALRPRVLHELDRQTVARGAVMGALLGTGLVLCTMGIQTTSVLVSAFVTRTTVVLLRSSPGSGTTATDSQSSRCCVAGFGGLAMITVRCLAVGPGTLLNLTAAAVLTAVCLVARPSGQNSLLRPEVVLRPPE
ncbi:MAG TPA: EamA family transporter [Propionibacteriaceae bacterium]